MGLVISALVTFWVGFLIYKKYKPQPVLFLGGMILMYIAAIFGYGTILPAKAATGSTFFDAFEFIRATMSSNAGKLGMNIMAVGAFARYMDKIGASRSLVRLTIRPLLALKSPYIVLRHQLAILADGQVVPCCLDHNGHLALGNIFIESLDTILCKEKSLRIIEDFRSHHIHENLCRRCGYRTRF